jgi:hypothetical protein
MEKQAIRKKIPLNCSQLYDCTEIEKKVDEILTAHSEVLRRGKEQNTASGDSFSFRVISLVLGFSAIISGHRG